MSEQIKACPFCGSDKIEIAHSNGAGSAWCNTDDCCIGFVDTKSPYCDDVISKWNHRPIEDKLQARVKELEVVVKAEIESNCRLSARELEQEIKIKKLEADYKLSLEHHEKKNAHIKQLERIEKYERHLRSSLNRLYRQVSNGERLDKEWIVNTLTEMPSNFVIDALNNKVLSQTAKIKQLESDHAKSVVHADSLIKENAEQVERINELEKQLEEAEDILHVLSVDATQKELEIIRKYFKQKAEVAVESKQQSNR